MIRALEEAAEPRSLRHSVVPRWVQRLNSARILPFESRSRMIGRRPSRTVMKSLFLGIWLSWPR